MRDSLNAYLKMGGDNAFQRISQKSAGDVFILDRLQFLEDTALDYSREEYLSQLSRAERVAREADETVQEMLRGALTYDEQARQSAKDAIVAWASQNQARVEFLLDQVRTRINQVEKIKTLASQHADRLERNFRELLPPEQQAKAIGMIRSRKDTEIIMDKVRADLSKFENILTSLGVSRDVIQNILAGKLDNEAAYEQILWADVKRVTRFNYPPIGGADSRLSSDLKAVEANLESLKNERDASVVRRSAGGALTKLLMLEQELPRLNKLMEAFDPMIDGLLRSYREFVKESDDRFKRPLQDFQACYKLTAEIRNNCVKYNEKIVTLRNLATVLMEQED